MSFIDRVVKWFLRPATTTVKFGPWFKDVEPLVRSALQVAARDGKITADVDDLMWCISFDPAIEELLGRMHPDIEQLRDTLSLAREKIDDNQETDVVIAGEPLPSELLVAVLSDSAGHAVARGRRTVTVVEIFMSILKARDTKSVVALAAQGIHSFSVSMMISHGKSTHTFDFSTFDDDEDVLLVLWNDEFTTMELVLEILMEKFGMDAGEAKGVMMEVHNHGRATVATWTAARAKPVVIETLTRAQDARMPLKITMERAHGYSGSLNP